MTEESSSHFVRLVARVNLKARFFSRLRLHQNDTAGGNIQWRVITHTAIWSSTGIFQIPRRPNNSPSRSRSEYRAREQSQTAVARYSLSTE